MIEEIRMFIEQYRSFETMVKECFEEFKDSYDAETIRYEILKACTDITNNYYEKVFKEKEE